MQRWSERNPVLDAMLLGPITFLALLVWRALGVFELDLIWCVTIALAATALGALAGLRKRRKLAERERTGKHPGPTLLWLGLADGDGERPRLNRRIGLTIAAFVLFTMAVGMVAAVLAPALSR